MIAPRKHAVTTLSLAVVIASLILVTSVPAQATLIDPSTLHIGTGAGTACAVGCGGDPNLISATDFDVYQNAAGANTLSQPLLVILGIPNYSGAAPTIASVTAYSPYAGVNTGGTSLSGANFGVAGSAFFGGTWTPGGNAVASLTTGEEAYSDLGLANANNSNSFTNWAAVDAAYGVTATSFGLYVYAINADLAANGLFDITLANSLPTGTFAIAYGCQGEANSSTDECTVNPNSYNTPFTEAGGVGVGTVPEPGTLVLVGSGMMGFGMAARRRWHGRQPSA